MADPVPAPFNIDSQHTLRRHNPDKFPLVCHIEQYTKSFVSIDSRVTATSIAKCHPQQQSLLFRFPAELRNDIFRLVAEPRGGFALAVMKANTKPQTTFLLTCRRIWLEANAYPLSQYTPNFWTARGPTWDDFMDNLTPVNVDALQQIHVTVEVNLIHRFDGVSILECLKYQTWPRKLIISFMSKPITQDDNTDLGACIAEMLKHEKMSTVHELEVNLEEIKSRAGYLAEMLKKLSEAENQLFELGVGDWRPIISTKPIRSWHREATNMLPYETYRLIYQRRSGTGQTIPKTWNGNKKYSWHLIPWREMYWSASPDFAAENKLAAEYERTWKAQGSLLKFADPATCCNHSIFNAGSWKCIRHDASCT